MAQLFPPASNTIVRVLLVGGLLAAGAVALGAHAFYWSPFHTAVGEPVEQPVPFSHQHHVGGLGIDCRYCHASVETSAFAGMPATETCMTCHSEVWKDAPVLEPVRASWAQNQPLRWTRVNDLPDYVYFDHSIHVTKGVGCVSCHGRLDQMPLTAKAETLSMRWCLDCHRAPERHLVSPEQVFQMEPVGADASRVAHIETAKLEDCSICHR